MKKSFKSGDGGEQLQELCLQDVEALKEKNSR